MSFSTLSSASQRLRLIGATIIATTLLLTACASTANSVQGRPADTDKNAAIIAEQFRQEVCHVFGYIIPKRSEDTKETVEQVDDYNSILWNIYKCPLPGLFPPVES